MSKLNPSLKPAPKVLDERIGWWFQVLLAARESNVQYFEKSCNG